MPSCNFVPVRILDKKIKTENIANGVQNFPRPFAFLSFSENLCYTKNNIFTLSGVYA